MRKHDPLRQLSKNFRQIPATFPQVLVCTSVLTSDPWYHSEEEDEDSDGEGQWGLRELDFAAAPLSSFDWPLENKYFLVLQHF